MIEKKGWRVTVETPSTTQPDIVILFLAANPSDQTHLALTREAKEIGRRLHATKHRDRFLVKQEWEVQAAEVPGLIMRHRPTIVHFSGHGSSRGALLFQDETGKAREANKAAITKIFKILKGVKCVLLNACYSEDQASEIARHIDAVIGMLDAIGDKSAIAFASAFYEALGFGESVHSAFEVAKTSIDLSGLPDANLPQLIARRGKNPKKLLFV